MNGIIKGLIVVFSIMMSAVFIQPVFAVFTPPTAPPPNNGQIYQPVYVQSAVQQQVAGGLDLTSGGLNVAGGISTDSLSATTGITSTIASGIAIQGSGGATGVYGVQSSGTNLYAIYGNASTDNYAGRFNGIVNVEGVLEINAAPGQGIRYMGQDTGLLWPDPDNPTTADLFGVYMKASNNALRLVGHGGGIEVTDKSLNVRMSVAESGNVDIPTGNLTVSGNITTATGDVGGLRLCINGDCKPNWESIGSAGGWTDDGANVRLTTLGDNVGIGSYETPGSLLSVYGGVAIGSNYYKKEAPKDSLIVESWVGIGKDSPSHPNRKLEVYGNMSGNSGEFLAVIESPNDGANLALVTGKLSKYNVISFRRVNTGGDGWNAGMSPTNNDFRIQSRVNSNNTDRLIITPEGEVKAVNSLCIGGSCKTGWGPTTNTGEPYT
ncbi:hypothetical protein CL632_03930, partial [bacterium]|nr:hypothetical protein [bacterium]